jgi:cytoskeletal protein CcmA (bactofilin family)
MSSFFGNRRQSDPIVTPPPTEQPQLVRPAASAAPVGFETVLGTNSALEGTLKSNSNVRLDGAFSGVLEINGNVLIGESAKITADVNARNISIAGAVRGNVTGKKVQILRTGRVWGDIRATALTTEEGAFIDGKITMMGHEANAPAVPVEVPPVPVVSEPAAPIATDAESTPPDEPAAPLAADAVSPAADETQNEGG